VRYWPPDTHAERAIALREQQRRFDALPASDKGWLRWGELDYLPPNAEEDNP